MVRGISYDFDAGHIEQPEFLGSVHMKVMQDFVHQQ